MSSSAARRSATGMLKTFMAVGRAGPLSGDCKRAVTQRSKKCEPFYLPLFTSDTAPRCLAAERCVCLRIRSVVRDSLVLSNPFSRV